MERSKPEQIGHLFERLLKENNMERPMDRHKACLLWGEIVGPSINRSTTRRYVKDTVLHVWLDSAPLKNELLFHRARIMEAINRELNHNLLTDIRIH